MDDENLHQESFFSAFQAVIAQLDRSEWDFDSQVANLHDALMISRDVTLSEKIKLLTQLHAKALSDLH